MPFVLDASVALSWCFEDEATPETDAVLFALGDTYAETTALFPFEVQNVMRASERRGRTTAERIDFSWKQLFLLDIRIEPYSFLTPRPHLADLGRTYGLTAYDASYLDLAMRRDLPLATKDNDLKAAAISCHVPLILR